MEFSLIGGRGGGHPHSLPILLLLLLLVFIIAAVEINSNQSPLVQMELLSFLKTCLCFNSALSNILCMTGIEDNWYLDVLGLTISYTSLFLIDISWCRTFLGNKPFIFSILRHCLANLRHIALILTILLSNWREDAFFGAYTCSEVLISNLAWRMGLKRL